MHTYNLLILSVYMGVQQPLRRTVFVMPDISALQGWAQ